eukprot:CAMPEP_0113393868 /NCGR_PEP_ID=MMETSP0013_2-20120614/12164_1 /TAXON_ID=2843 ORGANISM="Skeletonema costatum, Strain 1716" /NCGR_SAMPLE_ID=MMETSP0013_2 /ASSEMBLY_ACC=CAM_ASM_000158 /LENGTH=86 /DNA_ID=CAMNT_0000277589 /DNA_START=22 /DNA_END=278 /DNA_ORIENTATION=+ /assembly_acc=CAM_ASM_000158
MTSESKPAYDRWSLRDPSTLAYGYYSGTSNNSGVSNESPTPATIDGSAATAATDKKGFYITTAINYTNGPAHMGHAYEAATTDAIA